MTYLRLANPPSSLPRPYLNCAQLVATKNASQRTGPDIDGAITAALATFARLAAATLVASGRFINVTSRSAEGRIETERELAHCALPYSELRFLPSIAAANVDCPHSELDWFRRHLWFKVGIAIACDLTDFVDDVPTVIELLRRFAPQIKPWLVT